MQVQSDDRSVSELSNMQLYRVDRSERNIREAARLLSDIQLKLSSQQQVDSKEDIQHKLQLATDLTEQMNKMLRESEEQLLNNDTARYKSILNQQESDMNEMSQQIELKEQ